MSLAAQCSEWERAICIYAARLRLPARALHAGPATPQCTPNCAELLSSRRWDRRVGSTITRSIVVVRIEAFGQRAHVTHLETDRTTGGT